MNMKNILKTPVLLTGTAAICLVVVTTTDSCILPERQEVEELEEQYDLEQQQMVDARLENEVDRLRSEVERLHTLNSELLDDTETLLMLVLDLHAAQEERLNNLTENTIAVHECAQLLPFVTRARELCGNTNDHYCRVVRRYERHCHTSNNDDYWHVPNQQGIMKVITGSARRQISGQNQE
jgi:hypothetical protein